MNFFEKEKWLTLSKKRQWFLLRKEYQKLADNLSDEALWTSLNNKVLALQNDFDRHSTRLLSLHNILVEKKNTAQLNILILFLDRLLEQSPMESDFLITQQDRSTKSETLFPLIVVLENIRSAFNVGTILRTADCLNLKEIHFVGYTPTSDHPQVMKTSLGAQDSVVWHHFDTLSDSIAVLKSHQVMTVALETAKNSLSLREFQWSQPTALILGNERFGLNESSLEQCDQVITIPTYGIKNSLNVGHAFAIAGYELQRQWELSIE